MQHCLKRYQRGMSLAATIIALPVLGAIVGIAIQLGLAFQTKSTLNHAVLQAARAGSVDNASEQSLKLGLARGMLPLFSPPEDLIGVGRTLVCEVTPEIITNSCIRIVNPTSEAFTDFGENDGSGVKIPNDELHRLSTAIGASSGVNVQDANLLKVYVEYGMPMRIPIVGPLIARIMLASGNFNGFKASQLAANRLPIVASATVRMQSPLIQNRLMLTRDTIETGEYCNTAVGLSIATLQCIRDEASKAAFDAFLQCLEKARQGALIGVIIGGTTGVGAGAGAISGAALGCVRGAIAGSRGFRKSAGSNFAQGLAICIAGDARDAIEDFLRNLKCRV